jgi:hypothetical protein
MPPLFFKPLTSHAMGKSEATMQTHTIRIKETGKAKASEFRVTGNTRGDAKQMAIELFSNQLKAQGIRKETYYVSVKVDDGKWERFSGFMGHRGLALEAV